MEDVTVEHCHTCAREDIDQSCVLSVSKYFPIGSDWSTLISLIIDRLAFSQGLVVATATALFSTSGLESGDSPLTFTNVLAGNSGAA